MKITSIIPKKMLCPKCIAEGKEIYLSEPQGVDREVSCLIHGKMYSWGAWRAETEE